MQRGVPPSESFLSVLAPASNNDWTISAFKQTIKLIQATTEWGRCKLTRDTIGRNVQELLDFYDFLVRRSEHTFDSNSSEDEIKKF